MDRQGLLLKTSAAMAVTVGQALKLGAGFLSQVGRQGGWLDAEVLLGMVLGRGREDLYRNPEMPLQEEEAGLFRRLLERRSRGEPVAYITGHREFWSLDFLVTPQVLVPRPETERLVEVALRLLAAAEGQISRAAIPHPRGRVLDLGTGCGAIAVSLARERSDLEIWATDLSSKALDVARANAVRHGVGERIHFLEGDIFGPVRGQEAFFHLIVANPPYVRQGSVEGLPQEVREWEPRMALDGGWDGLDLYRRIIGEGCLYLQDGGFMALEIGSDMGGEVCRLFARQGSYSECTVHGDLSGRERVASVQKLLRS